MGRRKKRGGKTDFVETGVGGTNGGGLFQRWKREKEGGKGLSEKQGWLTEFWEN